MSSGQSSLPQPVAPATVAVASTHTARIRTFATLRENRSKEFVYRINGQKITNVRNLNIEMGNHGGGMAAVDFEVMADPSEIKTSDGKMDITTYGFSTFGLPPVFKQLQMLSDDVHDLANDIYMLSTKEIKIASVSDMEEGTISVEGALWSFIIGKIDEKQLTQTIGDGLDNLNTVELFQLIKPLVEQYQTILQNGLKREKN